MINDISNFKKIIVEEAYDFPPEGIHKIQYMLKIDKDGNISEYDSQENNDTYYKVEPEKVLELFNNIKLFMNSIEEVEFTLDDTSRTITLNYDKDYSESIPSLSYNKEHKYIIDLIDDFIESNCVQCQEEEL